MDPDLSLEQMISVSSDGTFVIWNLKTGRELHRGAGDGRGLACVAWEVSAISLSERARVADRCEDAS